MNRRTVCALVAGVWLSGCAAPPRQPLATASGSPEVTVKGVDRRAVIDWLVERKTANGFRIRSVTDFMLVAGRDVDNMRAVLLGTRNGIPEDRVTYTITERAGAVTVRSRATVVTAPGTAFESSIDTPNDDYRLQRELEAMRQDLAPK